MDQAPPRLSCVQCTAKRRKCDRQDPCGACQRTGQQCQVVQRHRRPRGRTAKGSNPRLEERVARIEQLLLGGQPAGSRPIPNAAVASTQHIVAPDFWSTVSREVQGLRDVLHDSDDEDDGSFDASPPSIGSSLSISCSTQDALQGWYPDDDLQRRLLEVYHDRVDSTLKVVYWPTIEEQLRLQSSSKPDDTQSRRALACAMQYMAGSSVSSDEYRHVLAHERQEILPQLEHNAAQALNEANFLRRPDVVTLQALVIYINALRSCEKYATSWTLVAVAARLGTALRLKYASPATCSPIDLEVRRRLWTSICLLDVASTLDRGSEPIVPASSVGILPLDIDDSDLASGYTTKPGLWTEMSYPLLPILSMLCQKRISEVAVDTPESWERKVQIVADFEAAARRKYVDGNACETPQKLLAKVTAEGIIIKMKLLLRRPPYKLQNTIPEDDDFDVLGVATHALEAHMQLKWPELSKWAWKEWPPWHVLAVALAELCKEPHGPMAARAYNASKAVYDFYVRPSSDLESGIIWKPITRLITHVEKMVGKHMINTHGAARTGIAEANHDTPVSEDYSSAGQRPSVASSSEQQTPATSVDDVPMNDFDFDFTGLYNDLDPVNGVSWLDWDFILDGKADFADPI